MDVFHTSKDLVKEELAVIILAGPTQLVNGF